MPSRILPQALALGAFASLFACSAQVGSSGVPGGQTVDVVVAPSSIALATGQQTQFTAEVTGTPDSLVTWKVDEPGGGSVDQNGLYTAPSAPGTFHVRGVSHGQPEFSGVAEVKVSAPPSTGAVVISPKSTSVTSGGSVTFKATVSNLTPATVTWKVKETSGCGSVSGGVYQPPSTTSTVTCHVVATSTADTSKSDTATVTVAPKPTITLTGSAVTMDACTTHQFTATVAGSTDKAVVWTATGGTISSTGSYKAPSTAGKYTVTATAHVSSTVQAQATVTVQDHILSIAIDPPNTTVATGGVQQFTATVTTTCGQFVSSSP